MIDVSFMGRKTARNPIVLISYRGIERDAKWRRWKDRAVFAGACLVIAVGFIVLVALWSCV